MHVPIDCVRTAWIHLLTYIYIYIYTHKEATHCKQRVRNTYTVLTGVPVLMLYSPKRGAVPRQTVHNEPIKQPRELYFESHFSRNFCSARIAGKPVCTCTATKSAYSVVTIYETKAFHSSPYSVMMMRTTQLKGEVSDLLNSREVCRLVQLFN